MSSLRVVFMGTPEFAVPCLKALVDSEFNLVGAYTQPDRPAGRGQQVVQNPISRLARVLGIEVFQPETFRDLEAVANLARITPDIVVVAAYGLLLPRSVLDIPRHGCLNVHPSLLPRHRGPSPIPWAILEGDPVTGVSMMLMDTGMDTGPVLEQEEVPISEDDTSLSLGNRLSGLAAAMLPHTIRRWVNQEISPRPQDNDRATYSRLVRKKDGEIDWQLPALDLWRRVRAFQPWPGCHTHWKGRLLRVSEVEPLPGLTSEPGKVVPLPESTPKGCIVGVGTGKGVLGLLRVQMEGKREVTGEQFLRGQRDFSGAVLGPLPSSSFSSPAPG